MKKIRTKRSWANYLKNGLAYIWAHADKWSQVGLLVLAIVGYIETVRPYYQLALATEKISQQTVQIRKAVTERLLLRIQKRCISAQNPMSTYAEPPFFIPERKRAGALDIQMDICLAEMLAADDLRLLTPEDTTSLNSAVTKLSKTLAEVQQAAKAKVSDKPELDLMKKLSEEDAYIQHANNHTFMLKNSYR